MTVVHTFHFLVEHLHPLTDGPGEDIHDVSHHIKVLDVVDVPVFRGRGDGLQLVLIRVLDA